MIGALMERSRGVTIGLVIVVAIAGAGWVYPLVVSPDPGGEDVEVTRVFVRDANRITEAALYLPAEQRTVPGIVFGAGSGSEPALYSGYGEAFARNGFAVLVPGPTYELEPERPIPWMIVRDDEEIWDRGTENYLHWIEYLQAHPRVDETRLVIGGHSGGANGAYRAAYERPDVDGLVAIAGRFPPERSDPLRTNILLATGSDDTLVPPSKVVAVSRELTSREVSPGEFVGSFEDGTALEVFVAPGETHLSESSSPALIRKTTEFALRSVGTAPSGAISTSTRPVDTILLQFGAGHVFVIGLTALVLRKLSGHPRADYATYLGTLFPVVGFAIVVTPTISRHVYHLWPLPSQLPKYAVIAGVLVLVGWLLHRVLGALPGWDSRVAAITSDVGFLALAVVSALLVSTQFVTFQLVTTVVLSAVFLGLLVPFSVLFAVFEIERVPRWVCLGCFLLVFYPELVPPYL